MEENINTSEVFMNFLQNKYAGWYFQLVSNARSRQIVPGYVEKHHIIPRSLGGDNSFANIVSLTAREHFICHLLLTKMTTGRAYYKMTSALKMFMNIKNIGERNQLRINGRWYEYARIASHRAIQYYWTEDRRAEHSKKLRSYFDEMRKNPTPEYKEMCSRISNSAKNRNWSEKAQQNRLDNCLKAAAARKGKPWNETRRKVFEDHGPYTQTAESNKKRSEKLKGRVLSDGTTKAAWFMSPDGKEVFARPLKQMETYGVPSYIVRKLIDGTQLSYRGWTYLPGREGEFVKPQNRKKLTWTIKNPRSRKKKVTTDIIIERSRQRHGDRYSYEKSEYISCSTKMIITCRVHGDFMQSPDNHIRSGNGCPKCRGK